jgi:hypothetical protein
MPIQHTTQYQSRIFNVGIETNQYNEDSTRRVNHTSQYPFSILNVDDETNLDHQLHNYDNYSYGTIRLLHSQIDTILDNFVTNINNDSCVKRSLFDHSNKTQNVIVKNFTDIECSICLSNLEIGDNVSILPCGHSFNKNCIDRWLDANDTCPNCRCDLTQYGSCITSNALAIINKLTIVVREQSTKEKLYVPTSRRVFKNNKRFMFKKSITWHMSSKMCK